MARLPLKGLVKQISAAIMDFQGQEERMVTENQEDSDCYSDVETVSSCENLLFRVNTLAPMVAPVTSQSRSRPSHILRSFQSSPSLRHSVKSPFVYMFPAGVVIEREEDRTFPLPENVHVWARYGFLDESYLHERRDPNPGQEPQQQAPVDAGRRRQGRMEDNLMRSIGRHAESMANESTSTQNRAHPGLNSSRPRRPRNVPQQSLSASSVDRDGFTSTSGRPRAMSEGIQSPTPGSSTPRTVKLTPSPQERVRPKAAVRNQASEGRTRGVRARNRSVNSFSEADARAVAATRRRRPSSEDETGAVDAAGAGETKEDELRDSHQDNGALRNAHKDRSMNQAEGRIANGAEQNTARRRPPRTPAEMERHKRNRAERLRAHGCHRTLYPRIAPGAAAVGAASNRGNATAEEIETVQWVDTLRISASIRGESLMATCTRSFAEQRSAIQLEEKQSEARACRTPDVSEMEGPDGLLHCAVLRGDHALAARAAQFLVDMRGANVNSRDAWGRYVDP